MKGLPRTVKNSNLIRTASLCIAVAMLCVAIVACGDSEEQTETPVSAQPAAAASQAATPERASPTAAPAVAAPTATTVATAAPATSGQATITVAAPFHPSSNGAIHTDDAFILSRLGVTETLLRIDFDGEVKPFLAESWQLTDGGTWEFSLRDDVKFHDGSSFDSDSVVAALTYLHGVANPPRGFSEETLMSVEATDSHTVTVTSGSTDLVLPTRLAGPSAGILSPAAYASRGDAPPSPVGAGTGPFALDDELAIDIAKASRNDAYWNGSAKLSAGEFLFTPDGLTRAAMLETGEADFVSHLPVSQLPLFLDRTGVVVHREQQPRTVTLYVNNRNGPFSDLNVRRAAQHAIDRQAIVDSVLEGTGEPAVGPFAPSEAWVNHDLVDYEFDPQRSIELLAESGYAEGELNVSLWTYPSRAEFPPMSVAIHEMLNDGGFSAEIRLAPWGALVDDVFAGNFDMFLVSRGHLIDAYDPEGYLSADFSCETVGQSNYANYCNPEVDGLLEQARSLGDLEERNEVYRQIQQILHDDAASTFINYTEQIFAYGDHVLNWKPHLLEYYMLTTELDVSE